MMKQIIGRGCEFRGLYILDHALPRLVACSGVTTPSEVYCRLGHQPPFSTLAEEVVPSIF